MDLLTRQKNTIFNRPQSYPPRRVTLITLKFVSRHTDTDWQTYVWKKRFQLTTNSVQSYTKPTITFIKENWLLIKNAMEHCNLICNFFAEKFNNTIYVQKFKIPSIFLQLQSAKVFLDVIMTIHQKYSKIRKVKIFQIIFKKRVNLFFDNPHIKTSFKLIPMCDNSFTYL